MPTEFPALERPLFFEGQRLTPEDLTQMQTFDRELRWLHNRGLHGWGIVQGLAVTGRRGARTIGLAPGYALDCMGRELVLTRSLDLAIPAVAAPAAYYVTLAYVEDADLTPSSTRAGACGTVGAVRLADEPVVRFQETTASGEEARRPGLDVVLATVSVAGCKLDAAPGGGAREELRGHQPYVVAGRTPPGATRWRVWPDANVPLGVATTVSTSEAGFRATPGYQAHVVGERVDGAVQVIDGYPHVENPGARSFDLCVVLPTGYTTAAGRWFALNQAVVDASAMTHLERDLRWHVVWMGIEA
jgi:hypothetical protein